MDRTESVESITERHRSIFANHPDPVVAVNLEGYVIETNPVCGRLLGYSEQEFLNKSFFDFVAPHHHAKIASHFTQVKEGNTQNFEVQIVHKDGQYIHALVSGIPIVVSGNVVGIYGIVKDITARQVDTLRIKGQAYISEQIALEKPLEHVLDNIAKTVEDIFPPKLCSILLFDEKEQRLLAGAAPNLPQSFIDAMHSMRIRLSSDSCRTEGYITTFQITENTAADPRWEAFRRIAIACGLKSCWSQPILGKDKNLLGVFAVYSSSPSVPTEQELNVIETFSHLASVAITKDSDRKEIRHLLYHDPLTGVANQMLLTQKFDQVWSKSENRPEQLAVLVFDFDNFLSVNRQHGHLRADEYLKILIQRVEVILHPHGIVSRVGGDAFAVLLTEVESEQAIVAEMDKIRKALSDPVVVDGAEMSITASVGAAMCPRDGDSVDELLKKADIAMVDVKRRGKDRCAVFSTELRVREQHRQDTALELQRALQENQFFVVYQPRIDLKHNTITSLEALIRWNHPVQGTVYPNDFIPIAEETGLIINLGNWVLHHTCHQVSVWRQQGIDIRVAVNVSGYEFEEPQFVERVLNTVASYNIPTSSIELEITESTLMTDHAHVHRQVQQLREAGISISIDDFGTGYSALGILKRYPLDYVKIDQSFVRDAAHDRQNAIIVTTILQLCSELEMRVIAEGVETFQEAEFLRNNGCNEVQGYLYSKPLSVSDCTALLTGESMLDYFAVLGSKST